MKRIYQYFQLTALSGLMCLFMAVSANAQRGGGHSGGGRSGGGGGGSFSRGGGGGGHYSGGGGFSRGGGGSYSGRSSGTRSFSSPSQGSFSRGRSNSAFSAPSSGQRGFQHSRGYNSAPTFQRGGVGSAYRGGSSFRGGYTRGGRYYPGGYSGRSYGYRSSPWASRGGYYYNRGFYSHSYYPRLGFSLGVLPYGYYPFYWGDSQFFYSGGYFYQYDNNQYSVVEPPIGAAVNSLPSNAQAININGQQYYELNGVYYLPITRDDGSVVYQVEGKDGQLDTYSSPENGYAPQNDGYNGREDAAPQQQQQNNSQPAVAMPEIGDIFYSLPSDSRKIKIAGETYYVSPDDFYYQEIRDGDGKKAYKVTGTPDDNPSN